MTKGKAKRGMQQGHSWHSRRNSERQGSAHGTISTAEHFLYLLAMHIRYCVLQSLAKQSSVDLQEYQTLFGDQS